MGKSVLTARLDEALVQDVVRYAERAGSTKTAVVESALRSFFDDAGRGVPDLPAREDINNALRPVASATRPEPVRSVPTPSDPQGNHAMTRQAKLNDARYGKGNW